MYIKSVVVATLTYDSGSSNDSFEAMSVPFIYVEGKDLSDVGTSADKEHYQGQERLKIKQC
jgi:hypothetical protein